MAAKAPPKPDLRTVDQAAAYLNVSPRWIRRAVNDGRLEHVKVGFHLRIDRAVLDDFVEANTHAAA